MSAALDVDHCVGCAAVKICTRWNPAGSWDYTKGIESCRPVKAYRRPRITEEPIPSRINRIPLKPVAPVLDAEESQRDRFRIRDLK
jgi:hypothetical protein